MKSSAELVPTGKVADVSGTVYDFNEPKPVKSMWFDDVWTDLRTGQNAYVEYPELGLRNHVTTRIRASVLYTQNEGDVSAPSFSSRRPVL